ncbi:MAG: hypothetical protein EBQ80_00960 [Proteobacteria bacterium]|nr:hypothetical protein [Pseudomonadota bacterium]
MIVTLVFLLAITVFVFYRGQHESTEIINRQNELVRLKQELENAARLSAALIQLDQLTINEQTATQLDILRHLGLEQSDINFTIESREIRTVGSANLYVRTVRIESALPYPASLYLLDKLNNTKKIVINQLDMNPTQEVGDKVRMELRGKVYGLDKHAGASK